MLSKKIFHNFHVDVVFVSACIFHGMHFKNKQSKILSHGVNNFFLARVTSSMSSCGEHKYAFKNKLRDFWEVRRFFSSTFGVSWYEKLNIYEKGSDMDAPPRLKCLIIRLFYFTLPFRHHHRFHFHALIFVKINQSRLSFSIFSIRRIGKTFFVLIVILDSRTSSSLWKTTNRQRWKKILLHSFFVVYDSKRFFTRNWTWL